MVAGRGGQGGGGALFFFPPLSPPLYIISFSYTIIHHPYGVGVFYFIMLAG